MTDDYRALVEEAHDTLRALLRESEPGTGLGLHLAFAELRRMLDGKQVAPDTQTAKHERERKRQEEEAAKYRRRVYWKTVPHATRVAFLFQVLGDEALTIRELTERLEALVKDDGDLYESYVRALVYRMYKEGELQRTEHYHGQRVYYRYFRPTGLEGPIAELDRHFHGDDD